MTQITGTVKTRSGTPLEAIDVSNGQHIVATDAKGRFELECDPSLHPFIYATRPDGYTGCWNVKTPKPGKAACLVLDPPRRRRAPARRIRLAHITDLHIGPPTVPSHYPLRKRRALSRIHPPSDITPAKLAADLRRVKRAGGDLDLVIATGDSTEIGNPQAIAALRRTLEAAGMPIAVMYGGADGLYERELLDLPLPYTKQWQAVFGPTHYALDLGRWRFVICPDEDMMFGPALATAKRQWLDAQLDLAANAGKHVVLAQHTEIRSPDEKWLRYLAAQGVKVLLFGHYHSGRCYQYRDMLISGTPPLCFASLDGSPRGFRVIELGRKVESCTFHPVADGPPKRSSRRSPIRELWKRGFSAAVHRGRPIVMKRTDDRRDVLVPLVDEDNRGRAGVACLDATTGTTRWTAPAAHSVRAGLNVADDLVMAITYMGELLALDRATGKTRWSAKLDGFPHRWINSTPIVAGATVIVGTAYGGVEAFDLAGRRTWRWKYPHGTGDRWPYYGTPLIVGRNALVRIHRGGVAALAVSSGKMRWEYSTHYENFMAPPLLAAGRLLVPDRRRFHAADPSTGRRLWIRSTGRIVPGCRVSGGAVCGWASDDRLLVTNISAQTAGHPGLAQGRRAGDGRLLWQVKYDRDLLDMYSTRRGTANALADPLIDDRFVWLGGLDGIVRAVDRDTGKQIATMQLGKPIMSLTAAAPGRMLVTAYPDHVACLSTNLK